jgi:cytosine/adenosine deaminase-related metal-dependent hydrolase
MRRPFEIAGFLVGSIGVAGLLAQAPDEIADRLGAPELIFYNGKIVTVDDPSFSSSPGTIVQALAVRGDRILATGATADIRRLAGSQTKQIDLKGRTVLPSLILTHEHPTDWAWVDHEAIEYAMPNGHDNLLLRWLTGTAAEQLAAWEPTLREMVGQATPGNGSG